MKITVVEPFYSGSHKTWIDGMVANCGDDFHLLTMPGRHWKWRMHGGAPYLARRAQEMDFVPDLFLCSDMVDVAVFKALVQKKFHQAKFATFFHENQITYPWSPTDEDTTTGRDNHYGFINFTSALAADHCFFNSEFHLRSFLTALPQFLSRFPDFKLTEEVSTIRKKSSVLHLGLDLPKDIKRSKTDRPTLLWNHRWEYDKNPESFYKICAHLSDKKRDFGLIVLGERTGKYPEIFDRIKEDFGDNIEHFGYVEEKSAYWSLLGRSDVLPVTSIQDFFGLSLVEALHAGVVPLVPRFLAYREHIPSDLWQKVSYADFEEAQSKTITLLESRPEGILFSDNVKKYSWNRMAKTYEEEFLKIVST